MRRKSQEKGLAGTGGGSWMGSGGPRSMSDPTNFRRERIEKLLHELRYEVERGMLARDVDE